MIFSAVGCVKSQQLPERFYYNQQQYYYPAPQYYYPQQQYYYPSTDSANSRYYRNPYSEGYRDSDYYYVPPTYHGSWVTEEDEAKARERSVGAADGKQ